MRTCVDQLMALSHIDGPRLKAEANFIAKQLESLRYSGKISNDAYLDAGSIFGAFEMFANLIDMGVPHKENISQQKQQLARARKLEIKYPGLNQAIESGRAS
ncbi:MAG: hypothetical protein VXW28_05595 [Candidatus Thermoplasmatota archaeon]|nr:hypothetical protein [Candidatus Thermoplasmatota archaeon]